MRLRAVEREFGDQLRIRWRTFLLYPEEGERYMSAEVARAWQGAQEEEPEAPFARWPAGRALPRSSLPAQEAAKAALRQGEDALWRLHPLLFKAYFARSADISDEETLLALAAEAGLDVPRLRQDLASGECARETLEEHETAFERYGVSGVPTVIVDGGFPLLGALPLEMYRRAIERALASG